MENSFMEGTFYGIYSKILQTSERHIITNSRIFRIWNIIRINSSNNNVFKFVETSLKLEWGLCFEI